MSLKATFYFHHEIANKIVACTCKVIWRVSDFMAVGLILNLLYALNISWPICKEQISINDLFLSPSLKERTCCLCDDANRNA